jgi:hypothetical protein
MPTPSETILGEFMDAWAAGRRPDVDAYLARAPETEREDLARQIHAYLLLAPAPALDDGQRAAIAGEALTEAVVAMPDEAGLWPALLPSLRHRIQLRRDDLVARLAAALGVGEAEQKVARYYHGMEAGTLDPAGVSRRVLAALAALLGVEVGELEEAGAYEGFRATGPQVAFGRALEASEAPLMAASPAAGAGAAEEPWDTVDELFRGGR